MNLNFDNTMNTTNERPDLNSEKEKDLESESSVDEIPEIKDWRESDLSDEEKIEIIKERRGKINRTAKEFGLDLKEDIEDVRKDLNEKYEKYAKMQEDLDVVNDANFESDAKKGLEEMKKILSSVCGIYEKQLQIEYLQYIEEYEKDLEDPELLLKSYAKRNLLMDKWETLIENMKADLEKTGEEGEEAMRAWARWVKEHPKTSLAILMALIAAGAVATSLLYPEIVALLAEEGGREAAQKLIEEAGPEAAKRGIGIAIVGLGAGAVVGGGILAQAIKYLSDEKNRDDIAKGICGVSGFPWWYKAFGGKEASAKKTD